MAQQGLLGKLTLTPVNDQISTPTSIVNAGDGSNRLFITERAGRIWILDQNRQRLATPFLDINTLVGAANGEQGLLSVAFHPSYASNGRFFVNYTNLSGNTVVSQFTVSANPNVANAGSEQIFFTATQPATNHNGGQIVFGPDGMLYIGMGDGGGSGDPDNYAQTLSSPLGKLLRFNVNQGPPAVAPADNPFVGVADAFAGTWALGLRNPWRFTFDRSTNDLWIADVGQNAYEEINFSTAATSKGRNYGWRKMEGLHCYNPASNCYEPSLTLPVMEYSHNNGCSITGGYRYRGSNIPSLEGVYLFADFCSLNLEAGVETSPGAFTRLPSRNIGGSISTFGEDEAGEIYYATYYDNRIFRIDPPPPAAPVPAKIGVYSAQRWALDANGNGVFEQGTDFLYGFQLAGAQHIVGDWNADGKDEVGLFYNGFWFLDFNGNGVWDGPGIDRQHEFGFNGVTPLVGDWTGNGRDKIGIFINGFWFLDADADGIWDGPGMDIQAQFGSNAYTPFVGDWNGDGRDKIGIFTNGYWYLDLNGSGTWEGPGVDRQAHFGSSAATPVIGDWSGDGKTTIGIYINGFWYLDSDGDGIWDGPGADIQAEFGTNAMTPVVGDWNTSGRDKIGVFVNGFWFLDYDGSAVWDGGVNDKAYSLGQAGDKPVTGRW